MINQVKRALLDINRDKFGRGAMSSGLVKSIGCGELVELDEFAIE